MTGNVLESARQCRLNVYEKTYSQENVAIVLNLNLIAVLCIKRLFVFERDFLTLILLLLMKYSNYVESQTVFLFLNNFKCLMSFEEGFLREK
jgi:hypothetical protein